MPSGEDFYGVPSGEDMNGTELNTLRRSLWLSRADAATLFGVNERTLRYWESGDWAVPDDVRDLVRKLDAALNAMADAAWDHYGNLAHLAGRDWRAVEAVLLRYADAADLAAVYPEFAGALADCHAAGIDRARILLEGEGARVRIVAFKPDAYAAWIADRGMTDDSASRSAWASSVEDAPTRAKRTA